MEDISETARKKVKLASDSISKAPLAPLFYSKETLDKIRSDFSSAAPFPHATVSELGEDAFMRTVREEVITELTADYKETDIFKVLQTCDLANLSIESTTIPSLLQLRDTLYSSNFRWFVQQVTGCPPLTDQVDCSCNIYAETCHLLCHDDGIGSRCVSYIVYLTDPDHPYQASDGGALELYKLGLNKEPDCEPAKSILPIWNQMVLFCVEPGVSFHSVSEVLCENRPRLSLSGWFHTSAEHHKIEQSSLHQLQNDEITSPDFSFEPEELGDALLTSDAEYLSKWINETYLNQENIEKIYETFQKEGSIQLRDFLNATVLEEITTTLPAADVEIQNKSDSNGWFVQGPPHKQRYLKRTSEGTGNRTIDKLGNLLHQNEKDVFQSPSFRRWLHQITGIRSSEGHSEMRCFRPGSDYTIAVHRPQKKDTLDAVLCFVHSPNEEIQMQWDLGEVGGFEAYLLPDTKEQDAAVYRADDEDSGVLSVNPVHNTLNLVLADGLIKFVKYVSAKAPGCRWDISCEYQIDDPPPEIEGEAASY